jgi:hypothetical protein
MSSLAFPDRGEQPACPCCHDAGYLPDPFAARPGDFIPPCCHQDVRWTIAYDGDDGASLMDAAYPTDEAEGGQPCDC